MMGDFMVRCLLLLFGYAYPAFQCYKSVVKSRIEVGELRFWCQFWIIVAILTVVERIADTLVAWLPMYGELKLALFIYLWYPKTKGSGYVFDMLLRPLVDKHETDIEQKLVNWRVKAWDLAIFYWKNCTDLSQSAFVQVVNYMASRSSRTSIPQPQPRRNDQRPSAPPLPPSLPPPNDLPSFFNKPGKQTKESSKNKSTKWFSSAASFLGSTSTGRSTSTPTTAAEQLDSHRQFPLNDQTDYILTDEWEAMSPHNSSRLRRPKSPH